MGCGKLTPVLLSQRELQRAEGTRLLQEKCQSEGGSNVERRPQLREPRGTPLVDEFMTRIGYEDLAYTQGRHADEDAEPVSALRRTPEHTHPKPTLNCTVSAVSSSAEPTELTVPSSPCPAMGLT